MRYERDIVALYKIQIHVMFIENNRLTPFSNKWYL